MVILIAVVISVMFLLLAAGRFGTLYASLVLTTIDLEKVCVWSWNILRFIDTFKVLFLVLHVIWQNVTKCICVKLFRIWMLSICGRILAAAYLNVLLKFAWSDRPIQLNTLHTGCTSTLIMSMQRIRSFEHFSVEKKICHSMY